MSELVLQIKNLSKSFGKNKVLNGINLEVGEGSVLGLMGENGAGKSTMMKCLFGIYAKDEGHRVHSPLFRQLAGRSAEQTLASAPGRAPSGG